MPLQIGVGFSFLAQSHLTDTKHVYVVITPPVGTPPKVAIVNFSSLKSLSDTTVVVSAGIYPRLPLRSFIMYRFASVSEVGNIEKAILSGLFQEIEPFTDEILIQRIQDGVALSPHTPRDVVRFCKTAGIIDA